MLIILVASAILIILGVAENILHNKRLKKIPIRIHVNGTRGKSTTTRLIAGALREAGYKVIAKTTGTAACMIMEDGSEIRIIRKTGPRIIEQSKIVAFAAKRGAEALVIECMAVRPEMQWVAEHRLVRSTIGVITNVRMDHLDEMGDTLEQIADVLSLTIPKDGQLVTSEVKYFEKFKQVAMKNKSEIHFANPKDLAEKTIELFSYPIFHDNLVNAFKVSSILGIPKDVALQGMLKTVPDIGVLKVFGLQINEKRLYLINAFAANDYQSTLETWNKWREWKRYNSITHLPVIALFNNRADRSFRVKELVGVIENIEGDFRNVIITGQMTQMVVHFLRKSGVNPLLIKRVGARLSLSELITTLSSFVPGDTVIFGFGNTKGKGRELIDYFQENGQEIL